MLKAAALVLGNCLRPLISSKCHHLAGNGGAKGAVRAVQEHIREYTFVLRSDVPGYYETIDHAMEKTCYTMINCKCYRFACPEWH